MTSYILVGPNETTLLEKAVEICTTHAIDQFDRTIIVGEKETSLGIDIVKKLQEKIFLKPLRGKAKAIIIPKAQLLTVAAQNALLKLLEEPPEDTYLFLLSDNLDVLLGTIQSRCQVIKITDPTAKLSKEQTENSSWNIKN